MGEERNKYYLRTDYQGSPGAVQVDREYVMAENRYSEGRGSCLSSTKPGSYPWILGEWSQLQQCD